MMKSAHLRLQDLRRLYELVNECRDRGDDPAEWRRHWFAGLARLTDADLALGGELGGLRAGMPRDLGTAEWGWENGFDRAAWMKALELLAADPTYSLMLSRYAAAWCRSDGVALTRSDMAGDREWYRCLEYDAVYRTLGIDHNVWCFRSVGMTGGEANGSFIGRARGRPDFTERQKAVVAEGYALLAPLVGGPLARFGEPSPAALSPRVRQVLLCILEGDGDKQIAARLQISPHTVNQYVKAIFQHFGVQSRAELMARWVRRGWANGFAWAEE